MNICFIGEQNAVKAELARTELELLELMEKNGITDFSALHSGEEEDEYTADPEACAAALFVVRELEAEGKIYCKCEREGAPEDRFEVELCDDGMIVVCRECGAKRHISTDNLLDFHAFLDTDALYLE